MKRRTYPHVKVGISTYSRKGQTPHKTSTAHPAGKAAALANNSKQMERASANHRAQFGPKERANA